MPPFIVNVPLFNLSVDLSFWQGIFSLPPAQMIPALIAIAGWAPLALVFFYMGAELWLTYRQDKYKARWQWVLLAVDIPPLFVQTHKAVEQIFAQLSGALVSPNVGEKYWQGKKQKWFSLEIISLEGYIQFLIRAEAAYRDLVEAAIYAQYPEAEITEVEDYVNNVPTAYPNATHDMFGVEFKLAEAEAFPIRTYPDFEYTVSKDVTQSDPIAGLLENFTRIGKGENLWLHIVIEPFGNKWKEKGIEIVKKIVANKKAAPSAGPISVLGNIPFVVGKELLNIVNWNFEAEDKKKEEKPAEGKVMDLTPGVKDTIKLIEEKIAKVGFRSKIRAVYVANKEVYNPGRCVEGLVGAFNQFHSQTRNAIVLHKITKKSYAFKEMRLGWMKTIFMSGFKKRKLKSGATPYILNIEELATIWHFPLPSVKTPLLQKTSAKRAEPPINLPVETSGEGQLLKKIGAGQPEEPLPAPPAELPYA